MRVLFAGTPAFAQLALQRILAAGYQVPWVLTQPDRPAGRGLKLHASPVKQTAQAHGLALLQPQGLRLDGRYAAEAQTVQQALVAAQADVMVVAAYGLILPPWALQAPRLGCLNIHASLLPRWRGAAPIQRALQAGDAQTGVTIMQMDAGLDTGDMLLSQALPIGEADTTGSLHDKLAELGAGLIVQALALAQAGALQPVPQPSQGVSYAHKIGKSEARIDWRGSSAALLRQLRAFTPQPGLLTEFDGQPLKLWAARAAQGTPAAPPGTVLQAQGDTLRIATADGALDLLELQRPGGRRLPVRDFLAGRQRGSGGLP